MTALSAILAVSALAGCGEGGGGGGAGKTNLEFWGWGDDIEVQVFTELVDKFNAAHDDIYVNFTKRPSSTYGVDTLKQLQSRRAPDVVFVEDSKIKLWASDSIDEIGRAHV